MKKFAKKLGVAACLIAQTFTFNVYAQEVATGMTLYVNGVKQTPLVDPYAIDGNTLVPLRTVSEALGAKVDWNQELQRACVELHSTQLVLEPGSNICKVDGVPTEMPCAVEVKNETCMVPIRFISEKLHFDVEWVQDGQKIIITDNFEYQTSYETDRYGHKIRTSDLPEIAQYFPYLQEDVPNWAYQGVVNSWNNNVWGFNWEMKSPTEYAQFTKVDQSPIKVNNPSYKYYDYLFNKIDMTTFEPETKAAYEGKLTNSLDCYNELFQFITNMSFEAAMDSDGAVLNLWYNLISLSSSDLKRYKTDEARTKVLQNELEGFLGDLKNFNMTTTGTFKLMPEAAFRSNSYISWGLAPDLILPVYVDFTVSNDKEWTNVPGNSFIQAAKGTDYDNTVNFNFNMRNGEHIQGVIYLPLSLDSKTGAWVLDYTFCDFSTQWCYGADLFDSLNPYYSNQDYNVGYAFTMNHVWSSYGTMSKYERCVTNIIPWYNNNLELIKKNEADRSDILYYPRNYISNEMKWDGVYRNNPYETMQTYEEVQKLTNQRTIDKCYDAAGRELIWIMKIKKCTYQEAVTYKLTEYKDTIVRYEDWLITMTKDELIEFGYNAVQADIILSGADIWDDEAGGYTHPEFLYLN